MSSPYVFPENPSPYLRAYMQLYDAMNAWSAELMADCLADDFIYEMLPKSLNKPPMTKTEFKAMMVSFLIPTLTDFKIHINDIIEGGNTEVVHATPTAKLAATGADWSIEYILIIDYKPVAGPDDVPKIARLREFLDSHALVKAHEAVDGKKDA